VECRLQPRLFGEQPPKKATYCYSRTGNVGAKLANILFWEGASLILSEMDEQRLAEYASLYGAKSFLHPNFVQPHVIFLLLVH